MKKLIIVTTSILAMPSSFANAFFGPAAYAKTDNFNTGTCQSIPPARPSGGATREKIAAMERCNKAQSNEQQEPSTSQPQPEQMNSPSSEPSPDSGNSPSSEPSPGSENQAPGSSMQPSAPDSITTP